MFDDQSVTSRSAQPLNPNQISEVQYSDIETRIESRALRHVATMLQRTDTLEKLSSIRDNAERKKAKLEARLKTALQSQLEGVKSGLEQLKIGREECVKMQDNMQKVDKLFNSCMQLGDWVHDMKDLSSEHNQLSAAMDNLQQLFKTPELISEAEKHIQNNNYLEAHHVLTDLEQSRDDLLYELYKNPHRSSSDEQLIVKYFSAVERLKNENLYACIVGIIDNIFDLAKTAPRKVVAAVKIIEREEYLDKQFEDRKASINSKSFNSCRRPYNWRNKTLELLRDQIDKRVGQAPMKLDRSESSGSNTTEKFF